ncbi:hypothetical protein CGRA01v4_03971 [Colletotrichum graminicola]|uniref:Uncharacterized protein n=1 Tax=Colletotrichum graminicola (strain M1.001 / M2 / FGSC 10212) TaxID=645133 RepID=E3QTP7_COLGM|nr:uncharacterized protein GLRG_09353 [Colletotrichum graminicola M1.001]EFQ34209.1 hypothetical protein GLRG_09353 [Colletotrichum graminicola M1.001]WDK12690.1 hypothetical protein CGRA01v4_03971 [Colletotrichum graminicola]
MSSLPLLAREQTVGGGSIGGGGGGGGMTLPLLLGIAIGGGVLLFICLAFLLVAIARRRHRAVAQAPSATPGVRLDLESDGSSVRTTRPRRLVKQNPGEVYTHMEEVQSKPHHSLSSLVLPWSGVFSVCGGSAKAGNGQQRGGHLRRNNSWIDEDAIHGPRVQNDGRRLSVRDSFILRTPTLPDMFGHENKDDFKFPEDHNNYSLQQPRLVSLPTQRGAHPLQMPLRRTPSYELAEKLAAVARGGAPPGPQSFQGFQTFQGPQGAQGPRLMPLQRLRHRTTESDLAEILRSTEQRLQNGTPSNSRPATRQRAASASAGSSIKTQQVSPTKSNSPVKAQPPAGSQSPVKIQVPQHVAHALSMSASRQGARTPSPSKRRVAAMHADTRPQHLRDVSQCSVSSDADSLFGETTPEMEQVSPTGLSTPSRRSGNTTPTKPAGNGKTAESPGSDASSSLSTLYSINEPEDDSKTGGTGQPQGIVRSRKPKGLIIDTKMCDPFVASAPDVPLRSPRRQTPSFPPLQHPTPHQEDVVKETVVHVPNHPRSASNSPVRASLDAAKRSSVVDQSQTQGSIVMYQPDMIPSPDTVRPKSVMPMKPVFFVSNTVVSMKASPGTSPEDNNQPAIPSNRLTFGQKGTVLPPPVDSMPSQGLPVRSSAELGSPESVPRGGASPTVRSDSRPYTPTSPTRKDMPSPALSAGSHAPVRYKRRGGDSPVRDRSLSRQPHVRNRSADHVLSVSNHPSILLKPADLPMRSPQHRDFGAMGHPMGLQATVAQLRRMNSQMSTFSVGSSVSDPESPTLPNMRGGGFSPERSNSRVSKIGRQNYLSMGTSPKGRRHTHLAIKTHRNSIAMPKARLETNKSFDRLRATVEEEEEEAAGSPQLVRGPRPMVSTPKGAGRGGARETGVAVESPVRRRTAHIDGDDQRYMDKASKRNSDYESASVLEMYIKAARLLGSPDKPATGA